jgi:hypothetical protein
VGNNHSREDHFERSVTRNVTGDQRKENFHDDRNGQLHKGTSLDKRVNSQKNTGRKNRDTKVTGKRILGAAGTAPIVGTPTLSRSLRSGRAIVQSPEMWDNIANGGQSDSSLMLTL